MELVCVFFFFGGGEVMCVNPDAKQRVRVFLKYNRGCDVRGWYLLRRAVIYEGRNRLPPTRPGIRGATRVEGLCLTTLLDIEAAITVIL